MIAFKSDIRTICRAGILIGYIILEISFLMLVDR